jgi:hypothetical protein
MSEDKIEHIDELFKEQWDGVDVQFNPAHWQQMQLALASVAAASAASATGSTFWSKIFAQMKWNKLLLTLVGVSITTVICVMVYQSKKVSNRPPDQQATPSIMVQPPVTLVDSADVQGHRSMERTTGFQPSPISLPIDSLLPDPFQNPVVVDSLKVDSTDVLKNFIFW